MSNFFLGKFLKTPKSGNFSKNVRVLAILMVLASFSNRCRVITAISGFYLYGVVRLRRYFLPANRRQISPFFIVRGYRRKIESYELEEVSVASLCRRLASRYDIFRSFPHQARIRRSRPPISQGKKGSCYGGLF